MIVKTVASLCLLVFAGIPLQARCAADDPTHEDQRWAFAGQFTNVTQLHPRFTAPYSGTNSLSPDRSTKETTDLTLYFGLRPWRGTELWINPEVDQGFGLSSTVGVAGFPSGEAYKVGANAPYLRLPRAFARHVFALGGTESHVDAAPNQFDGSHADDNVTVTIGKFSAVDLFDNNTYAHDPRNDFMNWSVIDAGAFDYAADAWGFTYGAAAEWTQDFWTVRAGLFQMSRVPNGKIVNVDFSNRSAVVELEERHQLMDRPGKLKLLFFANRASMANYADAVRRGEATGQVPDVSTVRQRATRIGISLNGEQSLTPSIGGFVKVSADDGRREAYEFTEINRSITGGVAIKGDGWSRPDDTFGFAAVVNGLSGMRGGTSPRVASAS